MSAPRGYVLYSGPSLLTGAPVVAVATLKTSNRKTGPMAQVWILPADVLPSEATRTGADASVCGGCPMRGTDGKGRGCYVLVWQAPDAVWRAWRADRYPTAPLGWSAGRRVRLGAYGDPAALPVAVLRRAVEGSDGWTGYTHQWRARRSVAALRPFLMASCDSEADRVEARARGWRTFRVSADGAPDAGEIVCPASPEGGNVADCFGCRLCGGTSRTARDIVIRAHGAGASNVPGYSVKG